MTHLGIDIGGTKVALRAEHGARTHSSVFPWPAPGSTPQDDLDALATGVRTLLAETGEPARAVGVAMPATVDSDGHVTTWPGRPSWNGLNLRDALQALFPHSRISWADDGDLAALAEADAVGCPDIAYLGVGTGVGGGVVLNGSLCPGRSRGSCEVGHMVVDSAGPLCDCGRRGCVQALASGPATLRRAARKRAAGSSNTSPAAGHPAPPVTFEELRQGLRDDEAWAVAAVEESCAALAVAVVNLGELLRPSLTIIGGGFADGLPGFTDRVDAAAQSLARPGHPVPPIRAATLGGLSSLRGAVLLARAQEDGGAPF